jgi:hypothetical protein
MRDFPEFHAQVDREKLREFLVWLREFLGELVETGRAFDEEDLFYVRLRAPMQEAWREAQPEYDRVLASLPDTSDTELIRHGLGGFQLTFKLETIRELFRSVKRAASRRGVRRLLEAIDTLLDSILSATNAGSALSELKDTWK